MRHLLIALPLLLLQMPTAQPQVFVNIGINLPVYPQLQRVPGYPVYYAPEVPGNFFFYDGLYWVFEDDTWYYSSWYNGPWYLIGPEYVPVYLLRVPVRYYRRPPVYFTYWRVDAPPRWGDHWGPGWTQRRAGWDHWDRSKAPAPAPLPDYQRKYPQSRYPQAALQDRIRGDHYRYQPRNPAVRAQLAAPPSPQRLDNRMPQREDVRRPDRIEPPAPMPRQDRPGPRFDERAAPPQRVTPQEPDGVRRPERAERPPMPVERNEPRFDRREAQPPMRPFEPEQRRAEAPERRAAPEPRQQPQWQPQRQPDFQPRQPPQQQQQQPPMRAEPMNRGQDRGEQPGQRRFEEERGRGNDRGNGRGNRD